MNKEKLFSLSEIFVCRKNQISVCQPDIFHNNQISVVDQ